MKAKISALGNEIMVSPRIDVISRFRVNFVGRIIASAMAIGSISRMLTSVANSIDQAIWWAVSALALTAMALFAWLTTIRVENSRIVQFFLHWIWMPSKGVISFDEIERIIDDHFGGFHWFYVDNNWQSTSVKKRIMYANWFMTRHKDFLRLVVSRVRPGTHVDESILKRIGFAETDIGKNFNKPLDPDLPTTTTQPQA